MENTTLKVGDKVQLHGLTFTITDFGFVPSYINYGIHGRSFSALCVCDTESLAEWLSVKKLINVSPLLTTI